MDRYYIDVAVRNKAGVLNRITSVFSRLSINIDFLALSDTECEGCAKLSFGYKCTTKENNILTGRIEKIFDVYCVEAVT